MKSWREIQAEEDAKRTTPSHFGLVQCDNCGKDVWPESNPCCPPSAATKAPKGVAKGGK